ncbi:hypothetical protein B296_00051328 [Ensete ventricosum]|uniref:RING-type E3 ubiquitin transferase n=1 Tax=Ensete ventricosum TaxID=4639 RepID=A0A426X4A1_ENSVE|nr:hypothetical protein B296_00051328 [Ensete ventricosum]
MDDSVPDTYHSPPRPIPYDDPRFTQNDGLISRHEKFLSHFHQEPEPLRSNTNSETESKMKGKCKSNYDGGSKLCQPESSLKHFSAAARREVTYIFPSSEDEDVCPTCLEEYTSEDPKITMQCSHHFHLGCIYEWMERSDACPVCGKVTSLSLSVIDSINPHILIKFLLLYLYLKFVISSQICSLG